MATYPRYEDINRSSSIKLFYSATEWFGLVKIPIWRNILGFPFECQHASSVTSLHKYEYMLAALIYSMASTKGVIRRCHNKEVLSTGYPLQFRHNECNGVSKHQPHKCLFKRLFRRRSKKTSKLRVTGLCGGNSPHKGPVTRNMFPFDDVIMDRFTTQRHNADLWCFLCYQPQKALEQKHSHCRWFGSLWR